MEAVLLLLNIWEKRTCFDDNRFAFNNQIFRIFLYPFCRSGTHVASAPLLPFLKRFESIPCNATQIVKKEKNISLNCNGMYRKLQQLPDDDLVELDLRHAALMLMSHLDRLATPNIPSQPFNKVSLRFVCLFQILANIFSSYHSMLINKKFGDGDFCRGQ